MPTPRFIPEFGFTELRRGSILVLDAYIKTLNKELQNKKIAALVQYITFPPASKKFETIQVCLNIKGSRLYNVAYSKCCF